MNAVVPLPLPSYTHIVLSGGGMCGLSYTGIYRYLKQYKLLGQLRHLVGCSMGSIFVFLIALNLPVETLETLILETTCDIELNTFDPENILFISDKKGIFSLERYDALFQKAINLVYKDVGRITLQEFSKLTGKNIYFTVFCLNTLNVEYLSNTTTPDIDLFQAIRASMAIPGLFHPVIINDKCYVDGGVCASLPLSCMEYKETDKVLAINISFKPYKSNTELEDILVYTKQIIGAVLFSKVFQTVKDYMNISNIDLMTIDDNPVDFMPMEIINDKIILNITEENLNQSTLYGYQKFYEYMKEKYPRT